MLSADALHEPRKLLKKYNHLKEKGAFSVGVKIKRALEKGHKLGSRKDKKQKKEKKDRVFLHLCS